MRPGGAPNARCGIVEVMQFADGHAGHFARRWPSSSRDLSAATIPGAGSAWFERLPEHPDLLVVQGTGFALAFTVRLFDPQHRIAGEQGALAGPAEQLHQYRAQSVGRDRRHGNDLEQQPRRVLACDRGGIPLAPCRAGVGAEITLIVFPRGFLPLGVALDVEIGEGVEGQLRRRGAQRLAVAFVLLLRIRPGANLSADALGGGAGLDQGEGGIAAQCDAAEGGSAAGVGSGTSRTGRRTS